MKLDHLTMVTFMGLSVLCSLATADEVPRFVRGLNLNGPAVLIDGHRWDGADAPWYRCNDAAFENHNVTLVPATDGDRSQMIRSSRWGGNRVELTELAPGTYTLFLYVWEDNNAENYSIFVNDREVVAGYTSGSAGHWAKLGPWITSPSDGKIVISSRGGAANFSGVELWSGQYDGLHEPLDDEEVAFFEKRVRPLLIAKCYECHSSSSDDLAGELLVDSRATIRRGGASGPAVVPGDLAQSLLIKAVHYEDGLEMPPDARLTDEEIKDLERWIELGAPDPRSTASKHLGKQIDIAAAREFWSLRPVVKPAVPDVANAQWPRGDIDRFVLAAMEQRGLQPTEDADKRTWIRRATFDVIGLPPTPQEVAEFLADGSDDAYARVVDRLLDSPHYGERWGRHWFDVVRYADTAGDNSDYPIPQMFRYRDWVIAAFNRDLPYDEFVRDQLAGDLRGGETEEIRQQRIIATGYLANARRFGSRVDDYPWHLTIEDTLDNLGRAFLGTSLSCARCHDHKFDPLTARDYYGLYGIFASTRYPWPGIELDKVQRNFVPLASQEQLVALEQQQTERVQQRSRLEEVLKDLKAQVEKAKDSDKKGLEAQINDTESAIKELAEHSPSIETAYAVSDAEHRQDALLQVKGNPAKPGDLVRRHFPAVMGGGELPESSQESGRRELAEWIVSVENPLPSRVIANRLWHYHFGRGLVPTPNDFGKQGKPPTHPELLDYLAVTLRESGWSLKSMHRQIMLSRTYRQSSTREPSAIAIDPANDWLAGFRRQRLDAEAIRDALLVLGGNLDPAPASAHPFPPANTWDFTQHKPFKAVYDSNHRSVYLMTQRIQRHPFLATFDGADPSTSTGARMSSTTPLQALFLMNDPFVHEQSQRIAGRVMEHSVDRDARNQFVYELLLARHATTEELHAAEQFFEAARRALGEAGDSARGIEERRKEEMEQQLWQAYIRSLLRLNEFVYVD